MAAEPPAVMVALPGAGGDLVGGSADRRGADRLVRQALDGTGKDARVRRGGDASGKGSGCDSSDLHGQERGKQARPPTAGLMDGAGLAGAGTELGQSRSLPGQFRHDGSGPESGHKTRRELGLRCAGWPGLLSRKQGSQGGVRGRGPAS